jgi:DNA-directed RNA polymerase sigma subunit (sigma70/sigma32)
MTLEEIGQYFDLTRERVRPDKRESHQTFKAYFKEARF